jgi:hypothetical protein
VNSNITYPADINPNLTYPVDALVSYHYFKVDEHAQHAFGPSRFRLIADSGAYSAFSQGVTITLADYAAWCRKWRERLFWIASLDLFGNPEQTFANWRELRDRHGLDTVPTIHVGCDVKWLDAYASEGVDFIGLGGMVGLGTRVTRWLVHVLRYARDRHPEMRFHAWGMTTPTILDKVPVYSADSSGLISMAPMYARLRLYDPRTRTQVAVNLREPKDVHRHRRLLADVYRVDPNLYEGSSAANRADLLQLAAQSVQLYAAALQRRHKVTAPTWGINPHAPASTGDPPDLTGPRLHVVSTQPKDFPRLLGLQPEASRRTRSAKDPR